MLYGVADNKNKAQPACGDYALESVGKEEILCCQFPLFIKFDCGLSGLPIRWVVNWLVVGKGLVEDWHGF